MLLGASSARIGFLKNLSLHEVPYLMSSVPIAKQSNRNVQLSDNSARVPAGTYPQAGYRFLAGEKKAKLGVSVGRYLCGARS